MLQDHYDHMLRSLRQAPVGQPLKSRDLYPFALSGLSTHGVRWHVVAPGQPRGPIDPDDPRVNPLTPVEPPRGREVPPPRGREDEGDGFDDEEDLPALPPLPGPPPLGPEDPWSIPDIVRKRWRSKWPGIWAAVAYQILSLLGLAPEQFARIAKGDLEWEWYQIITKWADEENPNPLAVRKLHRMNPTFTLSQSAEVIQKAFATSVLYASLTTAGNSNAVMNAWGKFFHCQYDWEDLFKAILPPASVPTGALPPAFSSALKLLSTLSGSMTPRLRGG